MKFGQITKDLEIFCNANTNPITKNHIANKMLCFKMTGKYPDEEEQAGIQIVRNLQTE